MLREFSYGYISLGWNCSLMLVRGALKKEIFDLLMSFPTELEGLYIHILERLERGKIRDIKDGIKMFQFVLFACRPLAVPELHHALAIPDDPDAEFDPSDESFEELIVSGIERRIIHCGGNILEIKNSQGIFVLRRILDILLT
jgi:hypothetical protein